MDSKSTTHLAAGYVAILPLLQSAAHKHGYALGLHGSLARDLDLIAAPWTEEAASADDLTSALCAACGGKTHAFVTATDGTVQPQPQLKPHGRLGWSIHLGGGPYIDVSVMPRLKGAPVSRPVIFEKEEPRCVFGEEQRYGSPRSS